MLADTMPAQKQPASAFGARLIALRKAAGLTQVQLAAALGISQPTLSYHEAEAGPPSADLLIRLAAALRVPVADLLQDAQHHTHQVASSEKTEAASNGPPLATVDARRSWRRFQQLMAMPEKDRRAVFRMIDSLAKNKANEPTAALG